MHRLENILLFLILALISTQIGKHFWPNFSFVYSLKIDYLSPTIYLWDVLVLGLFIVWILRRPRISKEILLLSGVFLGTQGVSLFFAQNVGAGLVRLEQYILGVFFAVYLSTLSFGKIRRRVFWPLSISVFLSGALGVLQFLFAKTIGFWILGERSFTIATPAIAKFDFYGREFLRPYSSFPHPNVLAGFLVVLTPLLFLGERIKKGWLVGVGILSTMVVLMTVSRSAIIGGLTVLFFTLKNRWLLGLGVILLVLSPILYTRFSALINFDSLTLLRREELSAVGMRVFLENMWFGVGLNNFIGYASEDLVSGSSRFLQPIHNIYLLALAETGAVGFFGWTAFLCYPIYKLFKSTRVRYKYLFLMIWMVVLFMGIFDHFLLTLPQGYRMVFLLWGLSVAFVGNGLSDK